MNARAKNVHLLTFALNEDQGEKRESQAAVDHGGENHVDSHSVNFGAQYKKQIVIVDDELTIRDMLQTVLRFKGFEILASLSDGADLVSLIETMDPKPDVVLLDERMPRMSGVETCSIIHARYPEISVIFISADESAKDRAMKVGAAAFLSKPISIQDLVLKIDSVRS